MKKKFRYLKSKALEIACTGASLLLILTITLNSCNTSEPIEYNEVSQENNDSQFDNAKESDAQFLVTVAQINLEEIQLGQLAQTNALMSHVKELGNRMATEHAKAQSDLQTLAAKKLITLPTTLSNKGMDANNKLMDKNGKDFDKEYSEMMVNGHKDTLDKFQKASIEASDPDIRYWARTMLPTLRTQLNHSIECQKQCEKI